MAGPKLTAAALTPPTASPSAGLCEAVPNMDRALIRHSKCRAAIGCSKIPLLYRLPLFLTAAILPASGAPQVNLPESNPSSPPRAWAQYPAQDPFPRSSSKPVLIGTHRTRELPYERRPPGISYSPKRRSRIHSGANATRVHYPSYPLPPSR